MGQVKKFKLRQALQLALVGGLDEGWLYLPDGVAVELETPCILVSADEGAAQVASAHGFPREGLDTDDLLGTSRCAAQLIKNPPDELLLESFLYYWRFDAWLPAPGAPEPLTGEEAMRKMRHDFYVLLGDERRDVNCRRPACKRGAIKGSSMCRPHHYEMVRNEPCPFVD